MMTELICAYYRRTEYGGIDEPVGYKRSGDMFLEVEPAFKEFSKTYRHGKYCWRKNDVDLIIVYGVSNSGKCYVKIEAVSAQLDKEVVEKIKKKIREEWCIDGRIPTAITP
jgi:hypothetical protein